MSTLDDKCIFCKIIKGEVPVKKIFEDNEVLGFLDIHPVAPIHYLFIPKQHIVSLADLNHEKELGVLNKLFSALLDTTEKEGIKKKGFRTVINTGTHGGQTVFHLHIHLISGPKLTPRFG